LIPKSCKRLAEVDFPIATVSRHAAREKVHPPRPPQHAAPVVGAASGTILLTPNERRVAEDRRDCYWLYVVTNCNTQPALQEPIHDPARFPWHEVTKVQHYWLEVNAMAQPMQVREQRAEYQLDTDGRR
jgi:hypothetical protein